MKALMKNNDNNDNSTPPPPAATNEPVHVVIEEPEPTAHDTIMGALFVVALLIAAYFMIWLPEQEARDAREQFRNDVSNFVNDCPFADGWNC